MAFFLFYVEVCVQQLSPSCALRRLRRSSVGGRRRRTLL